MDVQTPPQPGPGEYVEYTFQVFSVFPGGTGGSDGETYATQQAAAAAAAKWLAENWQHNPAESATRLRMVRVEGVPRLKPRPNTKTNTKTPGESPAIPADSAGVNERFRQLDQWANTTLRTFESVLQEKGHAAAGVFKRADKLAQLLSQGTPALAGDAYQEAGSLIGEYNALAKQLSRDGAGTLEPLPPLDAKTLAALSPAIGRGTLLERALLAKTKLEEAALRIERAELDALKQELEHEASQIQLDKAAGVNVAVREAQLAEALADWDKLRAQFQRQLNGYSHDLYGLQAVRREVKQEWELADRAQIDQERRRLEAASAAPAPQPSPEEPGPQQPARPTPEPQPRPEDVARPGVEPPPQPEVARPVSESPPRPQVASPTPEPQVRPEVARPLPESQRRPLDAPPPAFEPQRRPSESMRPTPEQRPQNRFRRGRRGRR
jgi:hypothetical protein